MSVIPVLTAGFGEGHNAAARSIIEALGPAVHRARWGSLLAATLLFLPPSALLGCVSPMLVTLATPSAASARSVVAWRGRDRVAIIRPAERAPPSITCPISAASSGRDRAAAARSRGMGRSVSGRDAFCKGTPRTRLFPVRGWP